MANKDENDALGVAAQAAYTVLTDLGYPPGHVMLVVLTADNRIRIADGGLNKDTAAELLSQAADAVEVYATFNLEQQKREAH